MESIVVNIQETPVRANRVRTYTAAIPKGVSVREMLEQINYPHASVIVAVDGTVVDESYILDGPAEIQLIGAISGGSWSAPPATARQFMTT